MVHCSAVSLQLTSCLGGRKSFLCKCNNSNNIICTDCTLCLKNFTVKVQLSRPIGFLNVFSLMILCRKGLSFNFMVYCLLT